MASALAGMVGPGIKAIYAGKNASRYKKVAGETNEIYDQDNGHSRQEDTDTHNNTKRSRTVQLVDGKRTMVKDPARAAAKARLYAMSQAQRYNSEKATQEKRNAIISGVTGAVTGLGGFLGSLLSVTSGKSAGGMMASGVLGFASMIGKYVGAGFNTKYKKKAAAENHERIKDVVEGFLNRKKTGIEKDALALRKMKEKAPDGPGLTKGEFGLVENDDAMKKKIVIARLGFDVTQDNSAVDEGTYKKVFNLITLKRARNIQNAGDNDRRQMLGALGLPINDPQVSTQEIAEALGYEG